MNKLITLLIVLLTVSACSGSTDETPEVAIDVQTAIDAGTAEGLKEKPETTATPIPTPTATTTPVLESTDTPAPKSIVGKDPNDYLSYCFEILGNNKNFDYSLDLDKVLVEREGTARLFHSYGPWINTYLTYTYLVDDITTVSKNISAQDRMKLMGREYDESNQISQEELLSINTICLEFLNTHFSGVLDNDAVWPALAAMPNFIKKGSDLPRSFLAKCADTFGFYEDGEYKSQDRQRYLTDIELVRLSTICTHYTNVQSLKSSPTYTPFPPIIRQTSPYPTPILIPTPTPIPTPSVSTILVDSPPCAGNDLGPILTIPLRVHLLKDMPMKFMNQDGQTLNELRAPMDSWVTKDHVENILIPGVNRIYCQANVQWVIEELFEEKVSNRNYNIAADWISLSDRSTDDSTRKSHYFDFIPIETINPDIVNIYFVTFTGHTRQGTANICYKQYGQGYGFEIFGIDESTVTIPCSLTVIGQWSNKYLPEGSDPQRRELIASSEIPSLTMTIAHELGHTLSLSHPDTMEINLMNGQTSGHFLSEEQIYQAREWASSYFIWLSRYSEYRDKI